MRSELRQEREICKLWRSKWSNLEMTFPIKKRINNEQFSDRMVTIGRTTGL